MALLEVKHLKKYFNVSGGTLHAVDDVSFTLEKGKTLGVVGESGCGKSTLGKTIIRLTDPTDGQVIFNGQNISDMSAKQFKAVRPQIQMIFQDPYGSLDPRKSVTQLIAEPMVIYKTTKNKDELNKRVKELMDTVGIAERFAMSYPHELDGGRRQRIGIARALSLNPSFIVCDEPVSALDVSIQAQILNLLDDLQKQLDLTYMFITHDLSVVRHISDEICVMYLGQIIEKCEAKELFRRSLHPYTKALLSAIPVPSIDYKPKKILLKGELSSPIDPADRCRFAPRCPYATEECLNSPAPALEDVGGDHLAACHRVAEVNALQSADKTV